MKGHSTFLSDLPAIWTRHAALHAGVSPLWLRPNMAVKLSSLPRYEIDKLIKEKRVKTAWRPNRAGRLYPLIYAPSLWTVMNEWTEPGTPDDPGKKEAAI